MSSALPLKKNPTLHVAARQHPVLEKSFWDYADLKATIQYSYPQYRDAYHQKIAESANEQRKKALTEGNIPLFESLRLAHTKGTLNGNVETVFKILVNLVWREMDNLRQNSPQHFIAHMRTGHYFTYTNRGQILKMSNGAIRSLDTISNCLSKLRDAKIIIRTDHTSRTYKQITNDDGTKENIVVMRPKIGKNGHGRGNFRLYIPKELIAWKYEVRDSGAVFPMQAEKTQNAENQFFKTGKKEISEQPYESFKETFKKENKNPQGVKKAASPTIPIQTPPIGGVKKERDENGMAPPPHFQKILGKPEKKLGDIIGDPAKMKEILPPGHENEAEANQKWEEYQKNGGARAAKKAAMAKKSADFDRKMPGKDVDFYAKLLWRMVLEMVYPDFNQKYLESITVHALHSLKMQMARLNMPVDQAFEILSYAILRQQEGLAKGGRCYAPMVWLNPDLEYSGGTLRHVVDKWVLPELKALAQHNMKGEKQVRWNYAYHWLRKMFMRLVEDLKADGAGLARVQERLETGVYERQIQAYFTKNGIGAKARETLYNKFYLRAKALLDSCEKMVQESGDDGLKKALHAYKSYGNI